MALPQPLRVALTEAELDDLGLLRAYPRATAAQLGFDHAPPLDQRRRHTKKGGGGGAAAEAAATTDTVVGTFAGVVGMYGATTGGIGGGTTAVGGSIPLSPITGSVPVVSSSVLSPSSSFSPSFPIAPVAGSPEDGMETFTPRTARGSREAVSALGSTGSGADFEVIPRGTELQVKMCPPVTAKTGKKKREPKAVSRAKVANSEEWKNGGICCGFPGSRKLKMRAAVELPTR